MDFPTVQASLNDLPPTFKRSNAPFLQVVDSESAALSRLTMAADTILSMVRNISNAQYGWLDFWGLLFGIARNNNESDATYLARTLFTLQNGAGPPLAIVNWIQLVWGVTATFAENFPALGYSLSFPPAITPAQLQVIVQGLVRVRPAGVPFATYSASAGPYLDTVNFLDCPRISGAYVGGGGATRVFVTQSAATPNSTPGLPTLFMTDPTLNA
jgi:hypothetical protein